MVIFLAVCNLLAVDALPTNPPDAVTLGASGWAKHKGNNSIKKGGVSMPNIRNTALSTGQTLYHRSLFDYVFQDENEDANLKDILDDIDVSLNDLDDQIKLIKINNQTNENNLNNHINDTNNPHAVTKAQIGLANVDNTSDANKNVASAVSATKLQTARNINGTSFDGTTDITTAKWGTARTLTIGPKSKSIDGSANVSFTMAELGLDKVNNTADADKTVKSSKNVLDVGNNTPTTFAYSKGGLDTTSWFAAWNGYELRAISPAKVLSTIGAATSSHTHSYLPLAGGTMDATKQISRAGNSVSWIAGRNGALIRQTSFTGYNPILSMKTTAGSWELGVYNDNRMHFSYITDANFNSGNNAQTVNMVVDASGNLTVPKVTASGGFVGNASTASKLQTARNITIGNKTKSFDGSGNISFSLDEIGSKPPDLSDYVRMYSAPILHGLALSNPDMNNRIEFFYMDKSGGYSCKLEEIAEGELKFSGQRIHLTDYIYSETNELDSTAGMHIASKSSGCYFRSSNGYGNHFLTWGNDSVYTNIYAAKYQISSSRKVKENIKLMTEDEANNIDKLEVVSFDYKEEFGGEKDCFGLIAEDTNEIIPYCTLEETYDEELDKTTPASIDYSRLVPHLIKKVQMMQKQINELLKNRSETL